MKTVTATVSVLATLACLSGSAVHRWRAALPRVTTTRNTVPAIVDAASLALDDSLATATERLIVNDPFRVANTPPLVRFDGRDNSGSSPAVTMVIPRPVLTLKGVTGGPPWQAMIDGIPGQPPGTIVRAGERFDKLLVRRVTRDSVVLQGWDTTWVLTFSR